MGMPPACSEALFNHLCQAGLLTFPWLARCSAVSQQWKGDVANALPTLRVLDFGEYTERVMGADVLSALTRVAGANLRVIDLQDLHSLDKGNMEAILAFIRLSFPCVIDILHDEFVSLQIFDEEENSTTTTWTMMETCQLRKFMEAFCIAKSYEMDRARFRFDETYLNSTHTPRQLGMETGDEISVSLRPSVTPLEV